VTSSPVLNVVEHLRKIVLRREEESLSDGQLLDRFVEKRDEVAFATLVRRHGPMVWGVCQRIVGHAHYAEDAFQAAFLILVRKAATVRPRDAVGNWLYGVACHTALKARTVSRKVHAKEKQVTSMPERAKEPRGNTEELQVLLDQELSALPDKYRLPVVLCDLEGRTRKAVATQLKIPEGTLSSRLATAHQLLAKRLARHGLAVSGGSLAVLFAQNAVSACVPASVVSSTIKTATLVAASNGAVAGVVSTKVAALTEGVLKGMFLTKLKTMTAMLLVVGMFAFGAELLVHHTAAGEQIRAEQNADKPANRQAVQPQGAANQDQPKVDDVKPKADAGGPVHSLPGHKERLTSVAFAPEGQWIATAAWDGTVRLWDAKTGKEVRRLDVPPTKNYNPAYLSQVLFSPDSEFVVVAQQSGPNEPGVIVWNHRTGERVREFPGLCAAIAPDGKHIACGGWGTPEPNRGDICVYELATGKLVREIHSPYSRIDWLTFSPDGKTLFSQVGIPRPPLGGGIQRLGRDGAQVRAWDVATGKERQTGLEGAWNEHRFALSPDGRTLALATYGISLRETATGGERAKLTGHTNEVCGVAFSPDGRTLASGSMDGTVRLWDLPSGKEIGRFGKEVDPFKGGWVLSVAFSPDCRALVSGGLDKTAHIWDVSKITSRRGESAERSSAELEADWKDLGADPAKGYAALSRLVSSPKQTVSFLGKHLQSAKAPDTKRIEQLIGNVDDDGFDVREQATKELTALGEYAMPLLQKALAGNLSLEARRRLDALLDRLEGGCLSTETLSHVRAVEALESIGNPEALRLLEKLATGPPEMRLTQEAMVSARRLAKRPSDGP
jgi:RNA polymerase sigma factor (sigma-70 family)